MDVAGGRLEPLESQLLARADNSAVRHGFFTRRGGVSAGIYASLNVGLGSEDERCSTLENRRRVAEWFGRDADDFVTLHQVHSATVVTVDEPFALDRRPQADALVTATPGLVLGVLTADCGPLLFADIEARVVGAAHAGWRGAFDGVAERTIDAMVTLGAERSRIMVALGPSISAMHYEVGPEFVERFAEAAAENARYFKPSEKAGHAMFDLPAFTLDRLARAGVKAEWTGQCTYADEDRFFSYRRATHRGEPDYGRQIAAISITE